MESNIDTLLARYFANNLDEAEKLKLQQWRDSSDNNRKQFEHYQLLWEKASDLLMTDSVTTDAALKETKRRISTVRIKKLSWPVIRQIAAVLIISMGLTLVYQLLERPGLSVCENVAIQEVNAVVGGSTRLELPDGSIAHLFSGSKLRFPVEFASPKRQVELDGEGYFEVVHNPQQPFIVKTTGLNIKVLGTSFNVRAYADEDFVETVLVEGKVALEQEVNGDSHVIETLKPNQRSVYNYVSQNLQIIDESDVTRYTEWKEGRLIFDGTSLNEVVHSLEKWYNVDFEIVDEQIESFKITGEFNGEPLEELLTLLQFTSPIEYSIEKAQVDKNGKPMKRKVVLTHK